MPIALFLYPIVFGCLMFSEYKKHGINASTILLLLYFVSSTCSLFLIGNQTQRTLSMISIYGVLLHLTVLLAFIYPSLKLFRISVDKIRPVPLSLLKVISVSLVIVSLYSMIVSTAEIYDRMIEFGFSTGDIRNSYYAGGFMYGKGGFDYNGVFGVLSIFALPALFSLYQYPSYKSKSMKILLFISSLNIIVQNLRAMSRDGLLIWALVFVLCYFVFNPIIDKKTRIVWRRVLLFFGSIVISIFMVITISRSLAAGSEYSDTSFFFFDYLGKGFINFSVFLVDPVSVENSFSTFASSFCHNLSFIQIIGKVLLVVVLLSFFSKKKRYSFFDVNLYLVLYYYIGFGVLYQHWFFSNRAYIGSMIIYVVLILFATSLFTQPGNKNMLNKIDNLKYE